MGKHVAFRILYALAAFHGLDIDQIDVVTAFLSGEVKDLIHMRSSRGLDVYGMVCRLKDVLYGLRQLPRLWYKKVSGFLLIKPGLTSPLIWCYGRLPN